MTYTEPKLYCIHNTKKGGDRAYKITEHTLESNIYIYTHQRGKYTRTKIQFGFALDC